MIEVDGDPYRGMSLADVTGDGLADLITPNPDHVAVLVAEEDGGLRPRATLPAPFGPCPVVAADLTGDSSGEVLPRFVPVSVVYKGVGSQVTCRRHNPIHLHMPSKVNRLFSCQIGVA